MPPLTQTYVPALADLSLFLVLLTFAPSRNNFLTVPVGSRFIYAGRAETLLIPERCPMAIRSTVSIPSGELRSPTARSARCT